MSWALVDGGLNKQKLRLIHENYTSGEGVSLAASLATLVDNSSSVDAYGEDHMTMTKVATMPIEGIDTRQLEKFNEQYASAPKTFELGIESRTIWEQKGLGNLGKVGRWTLGGQAIEKPTRDFSVQMGSWKEVGDAIGVEGADDRIEPIEAALLGLSSCVTEAIVLNCARTGVKLDGLDGEVPPRPPASERHDGKGGSSVFSKHLSVIGRCLVDEA